jgi:hypothetical protein
MFTTLFTELLVRVCTKMKQSGVLLSLLKFNFYFDPRPLKQGREKDITLVNE